MECPWNFPTANLLYIVRIAVSMDSGLGILLAPPLKLPHSFDQMNEVKFSISHSRAICFISVFIFAEHKHLFPFVIN